MLKARHEYDLAHGLARCAPRRQVATDHRAGSHLLTRSLLLAMPRDTEVQPGGSVHRRWGKVSRHGRGKPGTGYYTWPERRV